jgi:uncharacterized protein YggE
MPDEKTIQVQGHGEVEVIPDVAVINLGVISREREARAAIQAASAQMRAVLAAVQGQGVPDRNIQTTQLNLYLDPETNPYTASHQITVRIKDVDRAGGVLDAAVEAGANASAGVGFALSEQSQPQDRALELAIADARHRADRAAAALGVTIDRVEQLIVSSRSTPHASAHLMRAIALPPPSPIEVGQLTITADVQVTYSFRDHLD